MQHRYFKVGCIHGGMKPGSRNEPNTRLHAEQQFREGAIQVLVATEAAGEGINLQCCHILFNYDIPWNPNRLEQRMGRIHRYGQRQDCLIFNFVAANTIEGRVLERLLSKLQEIRDALDDDAVFNVVGEVLPSAQVERVLRDYYAGKLGDADLENRLLKDVDEGHFRAICQTALEGLATKKLNLEMLTERRAKAQERRVVPETIARFIKECAQDAALPLKPVSRLPHSLEWVTPGHPLFESLRRHSLDAGRDAFAQGACFHSLAHEAPARLDFYRTQAVDGLGHVIHERLFTVELKDGGEPSAGEREGPAPRMKEPSAGEREGLAPRMKEPSAGECEGATPRMKEPQLREPDILGNMVPASVSALPPVAFLPEATDWLHEQALAPFIAEVRKERLAEVERIGEHVELSLTEVLHRADAEIGRAAEEAESGVAAAEARLAQAEARHAEALARRERRRGELKRQRAITLQSVERLASVLVLPHPERESRNIQRLRPHPETEMTAMRVVTEHEEALGRQVEDVHKKNLGYDLTSLDLRSGELRLIEVKGLAAATGSVLLTPNERRVAEDRPDCYWLYIVTNCATEPVLQDPIPTPARFPWREVTEVKHYHLSVNVLKQPMEVREQGAEYAADRAKP